MPRPAQQVFQTWLLFFPVSALLGHIAAVLAVKHLAPGAGTDDPGPAVVSWVVSLVAPMPVSLALFAWLVPPNVEPDPAPRRARPPVLRPWLIFYAVSTVFTYVTSMIGGAVVGAIVLGAGQRADFDDWRVVLFAFAFFAAPPSWITFRWVVGRHYGSQPAAAPGNESSPGGQGL